MFIFIISFWISIFVFLQSTKTFYGKLHFISFLVTCDIHIKWIRFNLTLNHCTTFYILYAKVLEILGTHFKVRIESLEFKNCRNSETQFMIVSYYSVSMFCLTWMHPMSVKSIFLILILVCGADTWNIVSDLL